jgi:hypothetical protein
VLAVTQALCVAEFLDKRQTDFTVTSRGEHWLHQIGVRLDYLRNDAKRP